LFIQKYSFFKINNFTDLLFFKLIHEYVDILSLYDCLLKPKSRVQGKTPVQKEKSKQIFFVFFLPLWNAFLTLFWHASRAAFPKGWISKKRGDQIWWKSRGARRRPGVVRSGCLYYLSIGIRLAIQPVNSSDGEQWWTENR